MKSHRCNMKANKNRYYWKKFYTKLIKNIVK